MTGERLEKTLLVGLDAACWEYLNPLLESGRLPTIRKLMDSGHWGVLNSTMPAMTPAAWSTLITGKNPGKHGVFEMLRRNPGSYDFSPVSATIRQGAPFWKYLNDAGIRVGLINVPYTHPPAPVNGFMLCGFGTPDTVRDLTWPPEALAWAESRFGPFEPTVSSELLQSGAPKEILAAEIGHQAHLIEIGLGLAERYPVDVLAINLMLTDHANHKMPRMELVDEAYVRADADLEALLNGFKPDNILLISDHGSSRLKGDFLLNVWLRDRGYCIHQANDRTQQKGALGWILNQWFHEHLGWSGWPVKVLRRLIRTFVPVLPRGLQSRFWNRIEKAIPFAEFHVRMSTTLDFSRTPVFPGSLYSGVLYFNVADRDPGGVVPAEKAKTLASEIKSGLSEILEPDTGNPLFKNVFSPDEVYHGAAAGRAPDLIVDAYGSAWNVRVRQYAAFKGKQHGRYFVTFDRKRDFGWHSPAGIFIFSGPAFRSGPADSPGRLMDVTATLLHLYDVPLPADWDSRVLLDTLAPELSRRPVREQPGDVDQDAVHENTLSDKDAEALVRHLKALGYLD